jgi:energy-converting hydrogenase Eha subunit C
MLHVKKVLKLLNISVATIEIAVMPLAACRHLIVSLHSTLYTPVMTAILRLSASANMLHAMVALSV